MTEESTSPGSLRPKELEAVFAISQAVSRAVDTDAALDEITQLVRPVFIFDNIVLFEPCEDEHLETTYARAIGRGRSKEADLTWGEQPARQVCHTGQIISLIEELDGTRDDRTNIRHTLAMPIKLGDQIKGVLVFIRFGGPSYEADQIHLAEFIAVHIAQLLERGQLVVRIADLEARRRLDNLQANFIAMISHELMTPLGFIKGYATTLLRQDIEWDGDTRREFLTIIDEEANRLSELISNLMDTSRLQAGTLPMTFQVTRLDTLLKDISLRAKSLHENMTIVLDITTPGQQIQADPTRLAQVFDNLLNNSAKYAPGSPITIRLDRSSEKIHIAVNDVGPGISPEGLANLFERFYRAPEHRSSIRGTGLGLYICRKIIEAHNGEINAESTLGKGTTFHIYLPCSHDDTDIKKN